jgi:Tol biopolymer transport system component
MPASAVAAFSLSADGRILLYGSAAAGRSTLTWLDRSGRILGNLGDPGDYMQPRISPNGTRVAISRPDSRNGNRDVWALDAVSGVAARLTNNAANDWWAVWSPDGKAIAFASDRQGGPGMKVFFKFGLEMGINEEPFNFGTDASPTDWSKSGWLAFEDYRKSGMPDILIAKPSDRKPMPFLATESNEADARFSPDGKWIAYVSDETGRTEIYVRPFGEGGAAPGDRLQVSTGGGDYPAWSKTEDVLYYLSLDFQLREFDLRHPTPRRASMTLFRACSPTAVNSKPGVGASWHHPYDIAPDGRFLFNCYSEPPGRFVVWANWHTPQAQSN